MFLSLICHQELEDSLLTSLLQLLLMSVNTLCLETTKYNELEQFLMGIEAVSHQSVACSFKPTDKL